MFTTIAKENLMNLEKKEYPGRGIVIGLTPDEKNYVQVYWIMGRSENSRNRIFEVNGDVVRTLAYDESKLEDPSLIIYNCLRDYDGKYIIANGDQSDTVYDYLLLGKTFDEALKTREYEPDKPNFTPRITGLIDFEKASYNLSILKSINNSEGLHAKNFYNYDSFIPGFAHCIHTYDDQGSPLPSFSGEPYLLETLNSLEEQANFIWDKLNDDNRISLIVKFINVESKEEQVKVINKHK